MNLCGQSFSHCISWNFQGGARGCVIYLAWFLYTWYWAHASNNSRA
jgi:hypothetical protein